MAEPGWYPDPSGTIELRFWDGLHWTDKVSAAAEPTEIVVGSAEAVVEQGGFPARAGVVTSVAIGVGATAAVLAAAMGVGVGGSLVVAGAVTFLGLVGGAVSLRWSKPIARRLTGAEPVAVPDVDPARTADGDPDAATRRWLIEIVGKLADGAGIAHPDVAVYPSKTMNAFATGPTRNAAMVAVSDSALDKMNRSELCALLAHEVSHIANGDMVTITMAQGVLNTFVVGVPRLVGWAVQRVVRRGGHTCFRIGSTALRATLGLPAWLLVMWFSRRREYRADLGAAHLVGPEPVIAALTSLRDSASSPGLAPELAALGVRSPHAGSLFRTVLASHPDISLRIASLDG